MSVVDGVNWPLRGRWLTGATVAGMLAVDLWKRSSGIVATPPTLSTIVLLGAVAVVYGVGEKLADLTADHGLDPHPWRALGYAMAGLGHVALLPFSAGVTWVVADLVFHGVVKGKADTPAHFSAGLVICPLTLVVFAAVPAVRVDWASVAIATATGCAWMWLNNRRFHLGDNLFHQLRGDAILVFGVLAVVNPGRWLAFAVVVTAEHLSYAFTKIAAMRRPWYRVSRAS